jgi:hypothetical protein
MHANIEWLKKHIGLNSSYRPEGNPKDREAYYKDARNRFHLSIEEDKEPPKPPLFKSHKKLKSIIEKDATTAEKLLKHLEQMQDKHPAVKKEIERQISLKPANLKELQQRLKDINNDTKDGLAHLETDKEVTMLHSFYAPEREGKRGDTAFTIDPNAKENLHELVTTLGEIINQFQQAKEEKKEKETRKAEKKNKIE